MTAGQERAVRELERLKIVSEGAFDFSLESELVAGNLVANLSLRLGLMETRPGGLEFQECEEFKLFIPSDFPFERPNVYVTHERFAGFPHVIWKYYLCLYQSTLEWNPADGLFGFFDRFLLWLGQAAKNDMDPIEGPLEPPHHNTDFSHATFVIRANVRVPPGESWLGLAELAKYENRIEVLGWHDSFDGLESGRSIALAIVFPEALPMEFPSTGADFFGELEKQGFDRHLLIRRLGLAALLAPEGEPVYLLIGLPMRRASDTSPRLHIAVWAVDAESASSLRHVIGDQNDTERLRLLAVGNG